MKLFIILIFSFNIIFAKDTLIFYCGITMVGAMSKIAKKIEKKDNCKIEIIQGGSQDLYNSLESSKVGDLYLPGSDSYRKKNLKDGLLGDYVEVGYNQISFVVPKGNPKHIKNFKDLDRKDLRIIIGNPEMGSIGRATKKVLIAYGGKKYYNYIYDISMEILADSRALNHLIITNEADVALNWRATAFLPKNREYLDIVDLNEKYAKKHKLEINLLTFSKHKKIAKDLMDFAISKEGQKIMKEYGFR